MEKGGGGGIQFHFHSLSQYRSIPVTVEAGHLQGEGGNRRGVVLVSVCVFVCVCVRERDIYVKILISCRWGFLGRLMVSSCMLVSGCGVQWLVAVELDFLMHRPYCTLGRFRLRMTGTLLSISVSSFFPLQLHLSLP